MSTNYRFFINLFRGVMTTALLVLLVLPTLAAESKVLARIGNETVTEADLNEMANAVPDRYRQYYLTPEGRKKTLDYVVNVFVLAAEAEKQSLDKSPDVARLLQFSRKDVLARLYLDKLTRDMPVPNEKDAKEYYDKNRDQYNVPESVHLHHILVKTEKEAKDALARVKKGEKFADVATQISICPSKVKGGNLDWLPKGYLAKELEDVAFTMKPGDIAGPVQTKFGHHVLLLEEKKPGQESSFDQVKDYILEQLKFQKQQEQYESTAEALRKKMNVQVTEEPVVPAGPTDQPAAPPAGPTAGPKN